MNGAVARNMESLSRSSIAELLSDFSRVLNDFVGSPHLSPKQESLVVGAAQALDRAAAIWADEVAHAAASGRPVPALEQIPERSTAARECVFKLLSDYNRLKGMGLTRAQLQRAMIAAYNLLVVGTSVTARPTRSAP
jgi:hypothetical protein